MPKYSMRGAHLAISPAGGGPPPVLPRQKEATTVDNMPMMRPAEAAEALGVSLARLRRLAAAGRLVTVRTLGGHRRYREDDVLALQRWMQQRRPSLR